MRFTFMFYDIKKSELFRNKIKALLKSANLWTKDDGLLFLYFANTFCEKRGVIF